MIMDSNIVIRANKLLDSITLYKHKLEMSRKFGADGLKVFGLLERSTDYDYLRKNSGLDDEKLCRILDYMGKLGIIAVEGLPAEFAEAPALSQNAVIGVAAVDSLTRFRHQKVLFRRFSSIGIKVYEQLRKKESTIDEVAVAVGIDRERAREILDFMLENEVAYKKVIEAKGSVPPEIEEKKTEISRPLLHKAEERPEIEEKKARRVEEEFEIKPVVEEEAVVPPVEEKVAPTEEKKVVDENVEYMLVEKPLAERYAIQKEILDKFGADGLKVYSLLTVKADMNKVVELSGVSVGKVKDIMRHMLTLGSIEVVGEKARPVEEEQKIRMHEEGEEKEKIAPTEEEKEEEEQEEKEKEEEEIVATEEEKEEEEEEKEGEEKGPTEEEVMEELVVEEAGAEEEISEEAEEEKEELNELEKMIKEKFGDKGVEIYRLIDGKRTAEQIMNEAGVEEDTIISLFDFLESRGTIRLERPHGRAPLEEEEGAATEKKGVEIAQPIAETIEKPKKEIIIRDMVPIDVPILNKLSLPARMSLEAKLLTKFGAKALRIISKIDDESDIIKLSIENAVNLDELDEMLYSISNSGGCTFATLSEDDIKRKYGDEALEIYKRYGRDGIILYELIGRMDSIRKMVDFSRVDPKKAVEIIIEINELLGIEGVSKKDLYAELGIK